MVWQPLVVPVPVELPFVSGTPTSGQTLMAIPNFGGALPVTIGYDWQRCTPVSGSEPRLDRGDRLRYLAPSGATSVLPDAWSRSSHQLGWTSLPAMLSRLRWSPRRRFRRRRLRLLRRRPAVGVVAVPVLTSR